MKKEKAFETIIVLALVPLILYLRFKVSWLIYLSIVFLSLSIVSKRAAIVIGQVWFSFSHYLGVVMNYILMFFIFYLILTPLSFFQRLFGKNQLLKKEKGNSYFHKRNHVYSSKDIDKPW